MLKFTAGVAVGWVSARALTKENPFDVPTLAELAILSEKAQIASSAAVDKLKTLADEFKK